MKKLLFRSFLIASLLPIFALWAAAQEKFDIVSYNAPRGWQKEISPNAVQFMRRDERSGAFAALLLFKALPAGADSKTNFKHSWESLVEEKFAAGAAEMEPSGAINGWTIETGFAPIDNDGAKSVAMLISASGGGRVVNLLVMTNTESFKQEISDFIDAIVLPKVNLSNTERPAANKPAAAVGKSGFRFTTTNFDNGWTAVEEKDWVRVTKGALTVLLHYPHAREKETFYELEREARTFWDLLVAPRFANLSNFEVLRSDRDFEPARYAAGNVTDAAGKKVFVALFSKQKRGWAEIIAPDKATFAREFGAININDEIIDWKPLLALFDYNKFAVDAADLSGKWTSNFAGTLQYANIYTGRYVGASTTVSAESYIFGGGNSYRWRIDAASSALGRTDFAKAESAGKFSLPSNWEIRFSDIEGRPQSFPVHFSCIRGARVLWVKGTAFGQVE